MQICRRNAFRTDDVFISHPILGAEFEEADPEDATHLGGVIIFADQQWLIGTQVLTAEMAAHELGSYEESMVAIAENSDFEFIGEALIALTFNLTDLPERYGFQITEKAEEWMIARAIEFAEPDSFDVAANLDPLFQEILSWARLPIAKKEKVFEFLLIGMRCDEEKVRADSLHFLGCMALHESTPASILEKLVGLDSPLVHAVLRAEKRSSLSTCISCGTEVGYRLCLVCNPLVTHTSTIFSEDEANTIYLTGLDLARNSRKFEALEIWLPVANSGDVITIDAVVVTLWLLEKKREAWSWLICLASLDLEQFHSLIARLEIPDSESIRVLTQNQQKESKKTIVPTSKTELAAKCNILNDISTNYSDHEFFENFVENNSLGISIAYYVCSGFVDMNTLAGEIIDVTFSDLLDLFEVDDEGYTSLQDFWGFH
jgi:hypothetical protein